MVKDMWVATIKHQVRSAFLQDKIVVTDAESFVPTLYPN